MIPILIDTVVLAFAIALLFLLPHQEVTQPPGKLQAIWEVLAPGAAPGWGYLGGLALVAWTYFVLQDLLLFWKGSPFIIAAIAMPNLSGAYGAPMGNQYTDLMQLINPSWIWVYLAPALLFAINLVLVFRGRLFARK